MTAIQTIPIFRMFDAAKAEEFYVGFLGFTVDWKHGDPAREPEYWQVSRGGCVLHLSGHHGDACPGATAFVRATGLRAYHAELAAKNYRFNRPGLDGNGRGGLCVEVIDPFGNRLRFDESPVAAEE